MHFEQSLPPYGLFGFLFDFGIFLRSLGLRRGMPCRMAPQPAHLAVEGLRLPRLITERPEGVRFFIFFAFLAIKDTN